MRGSIFLVSFCFGFLECVDGRVGIWVRWGFLAAGISLSRVPMARRYVEISLYHDMKAKKKKKKQTCSPSCHDREEDNAIDCAVAKGERKTPPSPNAEPHE